MARLFFLVSGENPTLPFSEIRSILDAEGFPHRVVRSLTQVLRLLADPSCIGPVKLRSAMTRICGTEILDCEAKARDIIRKVEEIEFDAFLSEGESFVVRMKRVRESCADIDRLMLEQKIGEIILENVKGAKVNLKAPTKTFFGLLTDDRFIFGLKMAEIRSGKFLERGPRRKAFFHSAAMPAKLARCMVNLAQPKKGECVLDPFCGTGSFLVEAGLIGCRVLGSDVKRTMVEGSQRNLSLFGIEPQGLAVADARLIPLAKDGADCIVTDPPYGTSTTTLGLEPGEIFEGFLSSACDFLGKGRRICLAAPKTIRVSEIGERSGFKHLESHFIYIHRRLTREIAVFERQ